MWERFTYYGMRAVLVLFLVGAVVLGRLRHRRQDRRGDLRAVHGGRLSRRAARRLDRGPADRRAARRAHRRHGSLLSAMRCWRRRPHPAGFYLGLVVIVLGVGLLKPNVSAMVADLYPEGGARLDAGFTVFYMGINLGATLGSDRHRRGAVAIGPRAGFAAAAVFMAAGRAAVLPHAAPSRHGRPIRRARQEARTRSRKPWRYLWIALGGVGARARGLELRLDPREPVDSRARECARDRGDGGAVLCATFSSPANLSAEEKRRALVIVVLFLGSALVLVGLRASRVVAQSVRRALYRSCARSCTSSIPAAGSNRSTPPSSLRSRRSWPGSGSRSRGATSIRRRRRSSRSASS